MIHCNSQLPFWRTAASLFDQSEAISLITPSKEQTFSVSLMSEKFLLRRGTQCARYVQATGSDKRLANRNQKWQWTYMNCSSQRQVDLRAFAYFVNFSSKKQLN